MADKRTSERLAWLRKNRKLFLPYKFNERTVKTTVQMMACAGLYSHNIIWYHTKADKLMRQVRSETKMSK
ncbi:MAG: hypothetical protein P4N60_19360 [Verrucomicrobiae bacterium]|nr:hypothetical protein [Verrucomicrobiae bacterium]